MRRLVATATVLGALATLLPSASAETTLATTPRSGVSVTIEGVSRACQQQAAQAFLVRGNWFKGDAKNQAKMLQDAIKYRTEKYGHFPGYGSAALNPNPPRYYAESTTFMGMTLSLSKRVIPALQCVEAALKQEGLDARYHPKSASGIRFQNTYRGAEVSNHVYGIAIDIEPNENTCCGCVSPWNKHPLCKKKGTPYDRMAMPRSWVETFEKYGFYWLGHDVLEDTMHFEFLGDPDRIF
jgi:hypothetical protein